MSVKQNAAENARNLPQNTALRLHQQNDISKPLHVNAKIFRLFWTKTQWIKRWPVLINE